MDTEQDLLFQREQPATPEGSRVISSPGRSRRAASLSHAAIADPPPKEIKKRFKPGGTWPNDYGVNFAPLCQYVAVYTCSVCTVCNAVLAGLAH